LDRGPQFTSSEFRSFTDRWSLHHQTSTTHYPQSNGRAEAAVKSMKKIIRAAWNGRCLNEEKLCRALMQYGNTPTRKDGLLPVQKLYGSVLFRNRHFIRCRISESVPYWRYDRQWAKKSQSVEEKATPQP